MKFTTFIKAYKIALFNVNKKVSSWKNVFLGSVFFPENEDKTVKFIFTSGYNMQPGDIGISATLNVENIENLPKGGLRTIAEMTSDALDKDVMAREYISKGEKINEAGRMLVLLETLLLRLQTMEPDTWESSKIESMIFDFDKDIAEFSIDNKRVYTNGSLVLLGD